MHVIPPRRSAGCPMCLCPSHAPLLVTVDTPRPWPRTGRGGHAALGAPSRREVAECEGGRYQYYGRVPHNGGGGGGGGDERAVEARCTPSFMRRSRVVLSTYGRHRQTAFWAKKFVLSRTSRVSSRFVGGSFPGQRRTAIRAPRTPRPAPAQARSARVLSPRSARPRDQRASRGWCARRELLSTSGIVESPPLARPVARPSPCRAWTPS